MIYGFLIFLCNLCILYLPSKPKRSTIMDNRSDLYKHQLLDLAKNPRNYGLMPGTDFCSHQMNPSCGDSVTVCGFIQDGKVSSARFEGSGCVLSLAMTSLLTDHVVDMAIDEILNLDEQVVEKLLQMSLGINRLQCGMLSVIALQQGLRKYKESL
jgi:NifU-like protein involved in Fe-S cluster formation